MTTENLSLFKALGAKMDYLNQRQRVLAQNISNADTPNYKPQDLTPVDFGDVLENVTKSSQSNVRLDRANTAHMPPPDHIDNPDERKQKKTYEIAPAGNAVIMEEQLIQSGRTVADYNLMTNIYQKNVGMIRTALGRN
jgi:flagellar basal-body rod protein FlgB